MKALLALLSGPQPLIMGVVIVGCATAGLLTGHLDEAGWLGVTGGVGGIGGLATTAHVVGSQVNAAAGNAPPAAVTTTPTAGTV